MRIESQTNFSNERLAKNTAENKAAGSFAAAINKSQSKFQLDSLNLLMKHVDVQGEKLAKQRTLENLLHYKNSIKRFIGETLHSGLKLSDKQSLNSHGGMKTHQLIEVIDEKLIEIHDEVINNEVEEIDLLRLIGEMKGLLINLYM